MTTDDPIAILPNRPPFEVTMEKFILTFAWVADEAGHSPEAISDTAWLLWRTWVAVEKYDGWPACPAVAAARRAAMLASIREKADPETWRLVSELEDFTLLTTPMPMLSVVPTPLTPNPDDPDTG